MSNNIKIIGNKIETNSDWNYDFNTNIINYVQIEGDAYANTITGLTSSIEVSNKKVSFELRNNFYLYLNQEGNPGDIYLIKIESQAFNLDYIVSYWIPYIKTNTDSSIRNYAGSKDYGNTIQIFLEASDIESTQNSVYDLCTPCQDYIQFSGLNIDSMPISVSKINCFGLKYFFNWNNQLEYNSEPYVAIQDAKVKVSNSLYFDKILTYKGTEVTTDIKNQLLKILTGTGNSVQETSYNFYKFPLNDIKEHLVIGIRNSTYSGSTDFSDLFLDYFTDDNYFTIVESGKTKTLYLRHNQVYARYVKNDYVYIAFSKDYSLGVLPIKIPESNLEQ